jgi:chromosome segregation ATPase
LEEECDKNQDIKVSFNDLIKKNNELCEADASKSEEITKCSDYISKLESAIVDLHESIKSKDKEIEKHNDDLININEKVKELISVNKKLLESNKENEKVISEINDIGIEKKLFLMSISELNSKIEKNKDLLNLTKNQLKDNPICLSEEEAIKIIEVLSDENDIYHTLEEKIKKFKDFKYGITTSEKYTYNDACPACGSRSARCRCTD